MGRFRMKRDGQKKKLGLKDIPTHELAIMGSEIETEINLRMIYEYIEYIGDFFTSDRDFPAPLLTEVKQELGKIVHHLKDKGGRRRS